MRNLAEYFALPDWPMKNSPLGRAVQETAEKRPEFTPEQCLAYAKQALYEAAGRKQYVVKILSAKEEEAKKAQLARYDAKKRAARKTAKHSTTAKTPTEPSHTRASSVTGEEQHPPQTPARHIPEVVKENP